MNTENQASKVNLGSKVVGEIELPKFDPTPFIGVKSTIDSVEEMEGEFGYFVRLSSAALGKMKVKDGEKDIVATLNLGLQEDAAENVGWGADTNMGRFLKSHGVSHYNELKGKAITVQATKPNKDGQRFLTF